MKRVLIIVVATALVGAVSVTAKVFVNESFEGAFPPPGWKTVKRGNAGWVKDKNHNYGWYFANGTAGSYEEGMCRATLASPGFNVRKKNKYYYFFFYRLGEDGDGSGGLEFYIKSVEPAVGNFLYRKLPVVEWTWRRGVFYAPVDARVKACWRVWAECYWGYHGARAGIDMVVISDEQRFPAVSPASLGHVKALFK